MKNKILLTIFMLVLMQTVNAQDTRIPFSKGVLKICSEKNFIIKGYNGKDVIIKNLHTTKRQRLYFEGDTLRSENVIMKTDSTFLVFKTNNKNEDRAKGLQRLGKSTLAKEKGIYLIIEHENDELIIKDDIYNTFTIPVNEKYEITIPNSIALKWNTDDCKKEVEAYYSLDFSSINLELTNFKGEVEISLSLNNLKLTDVSGPVSINSLEGNITVIFDKILPKNLYSIYSNYGFIDVTLPTKSNVLIDANAAEILSDIDFTIISENKKDDTIQMNLKLGKGKVNMKLDSGWGNIYLRKE